MTWCTDNNLDKTFYYNQEDIKLIHDCDNVIIQNKPIYEFLGIKKGEGIIDTYIFDALEMKKEEAFLYFNAYSIDPVKSYTLFCNSDKNKIYGEYDVFVQEVQFDLNKSLITYNNTRPDRTLHAFGFHKFMEDKVYLEDCKKQPWWSELNDCLVSYARKEYFLIPNMIKTYKAYLETEHSIELINQYLDTKLDNVNVDLEL